MAPALAGGFFTTSLHLVNWDKRDTGLEMVTKFSPALAGKRWAIPSQTEEEQGASVCGRWSMVTGFLVPEKEPHHHRWRLSTVRPGGAWGRVGARITTCSGGLKGHPSVGALLRFWGQQSQLWRRNFLHIYIHICVYMNTLIYIYAFRKKNIYEFYIASEYICMYIYMCVYVFFFRFFSLIGYYKTLSIVPCGV